MYILGIESSCDETSAAVIEADGGCVVQRSNIIASQIELHRRYGGVVPEIAGRAHTEAISGITYEALKQAGISVCELSAVGVTNRPGLIGALLVGVGFAKSLAYANGIPLVAVNHICGHIAASAFCNPAPEPPFTALVVSGGHTSIIEVVSRTEQITIGTTRDDAAGEAFDKVGRLLGLLYPAGAEMDRLAREGNRSAIRFPSAAIAGDTLDFSFSGLKTAAINLLNTATQRGESVNTADFAASFTNAVVSSLIHRLGEAHAAHPMRSLVLAGGVAANSHLRAAATEFCDGNGIKFYPAPVSLCGDNGAMIAAEAYFRFIAPGFVPAPVTLNACACDD